MKFRNNAKCIKRPLVACAINVLFCPIGANAQSSVTLYGVVDNGIVYQNSATTPGSNANGRSAVKMTAGVLYGNRFGLKGTEDLGGGSSAIFTLESGFNLNTGASQFTNAEFGRQSFVGVANTHYGALTLGRQYSAYYQLLAPYSPTTYLSGFFGAHPGDLDALDTIYRQNNAIVYLSPKLYGVTFGAAYSLGGVVGDVNRGTTWSAGLSYASGPVGLAAAFQRIENSTVGGGVWGDASTTSSGGEVGISAVTNGYRTNAAQQRVAMTGDYAFTSKLDLSLSLSNVEYIPGVNSAFTDRAIFNTGGVVLRYVAAPQWTFAAGYSYTAASKANGIDNPARYQQIALAQYYNLSKRTLLYAMEGYQRANGQTLGSAGGGHVINATPSIGDGFQGTPASGRSQLAFGLSIAHRF